jgi:putative ABC transport system permease protein
MGFSTGRVLALLLSEGVLLVGAGGLLGVLLANLVAGLIRSSLGAAMPFFADFDIVPATVLACLAGALAIGLLATFIPAYAATRRPITEGLKAVG